MRRSEAAERKALQARLAAALGRRVGDPVPDPPAIDEPTARLVHAALGLAELFESQAKACGMHVHTPRVDDLVDTLAGLLRQLSEREGRTLRMALSEQGLPAKLQLASLLGERGFDATPLGALDKAGWFGLDVAISDVAYAVAETGSLVVVPAPAHPRALTLQATTHIAIIEPRQLVPDLLDVMSAGVGDMTLITGPSKTADIEMTLVQGVHGPKEVHVVLLS